MSIRVDSSDLPVVGSLKIQVYIAFPGGAGQGIIISLKNCRIFKRRVGRYY